MNLLMGEGEVTAYRGRPLDPGVFLAQHPHARAPPGPLSVN